VEYLATINAQRVVEKTACRASPRVPPSAVDHVKVDWMEQAAKKAKSHLEHQAFSHDSLVQQLAFEGFTPGEAEHGATAA
jgi:hypothetical protein